MSDTTQTGPKMDRPIPGPPVIGVTCEVEILHELLTVERKRLDMAHKMEADRNIVFPETTVIVRDVLRLLGMIRAKEEASDADAAQATADAAADNDPLTAILKEAS